MSNFREITPPLSSESGALNEELLETSYTELQIYQARLRELAYHHKAAFPGKSKCVLHSHEDGTNMFSASCIT